MADSSETALPVLEQAGDEGIKNVELLGRISLIVCIVGALASAIIIAVAQPTRIQIMHRIFFPFLGCEMIAFVTGVFARNTLAGKLGWSISMLLFAVFIAAMLRH